MRFKIRTKLILSFFAPIIPLTVIVVIVSGYILNNLYDEAQRLDSISKEMIKVADLRLSLDRALMPVNDYIITGNKKYIEDFKAISMDVERGLKEVEEILPHMEEIGFDDEVKEEREILKDVNSSWQNIKEISLKIFAIPEPLGNKDAARLMEEMDYKWGYPAIERLNGWGEIDLNKYKEILEKHNMAWRQLWITMAANVISFLVICLVYVLFYSRYAARNEEELRNKEERYKVLVKAVPDVIFRLSKDGIFLDFKGEEGELYVSPNIFMGKKISDVLPQDVAQQATHFMEQVIKTGDIQTFEYKLPMPEGMQNYEARLSATEDGFLVIVRNITEHKKAEEKLREQLDELERFQKVAVKREFRIKELQERVKELEKE